MKYTYVLVCGSREFRDIDYLDRKLDRLLKHLNPIIVQGGATGADQLAIGYCLRKYVPHLTFPAAWRFNRPGYDKTAGLKRNTQMAKFVVARKGYCIAFWDGRSGGTKDMIDKAEKHGIETRVLLYKKRKRKK